MIPQRYEYYNANIEPRSDGRLLFFTDAEKWVGEEVAVLTAQRDHATKDVEELIRERRALLDDRETLTAENAALTDKLQEVRQNYNTAFNEWHRCIEEIAALKEKIKEQGEAIYCPTCGACGEEGCCPPDRCEHLKCFYGEHYANTYRELEAENERLRNGKQTGRLRRGRR